MKKKMEQIVEDLLKNLLNALHITQREIEEKLNQVIAQTKSYTESIQNAPVSEKSQTPIRKNTVIMEETENAESINEIENKLCSKKFIVHGVEESSIVSKGDTIKSDIVCITNFLAALKGSSTAKAAR